MKKLLVLANEFPYGTWEPYMETEEGYYSSFDKVWIASLQLRSEHEKTKRELKSRADVIPVPYKSRIFYLINCLTILADANLYREIIRLAKSGKLSLSRVIDLFVFMSRAHHEARVIDSVLKNEEKDDILLYSYRFEYQPYIALLLKKKWKKKQYIVSRAHRYDLYEEQHANGYIPLRNEILNTVDYVFPCSKHGVEYIKEKYGKTKATIECRYLGTVDYGERLISRAMRPLKIISCSNVVKVKRLEKIVNALSIIENVDIEWTHYGDGPLLEHIKQLAEEKLGENIKAFFQGNVANQELLSIYKSTDYHFFLNVSSSEGLPVSIMEAMSFGIPCIATDAGGTKEIVDDCINGLLLHKDSTTESIKDVIVSVANMSEDKYTRMRENARKKWEKYFSSEYNYTDFSKFLFDLK